MADLNDMQQYLIHEFVEDYEDGLLSRRDLLRSILHITGGIGATVAVLGSLGVTGSAAQDATRVAPPVTAQPRSPLSVPETDASVVGDMIEFPGQNGTTMAYQARPVNAATPSGETGAGTTPLILVCHANRGLTNHIRDVARRFAKAGYVGCAVDLLSPEGGTAAIADPSQISGMLTNGDLGRHVTAFQAAATYYKTQSWLAADQLGMIGFCLGGGITWRAATMMPELKAAAPFYGPPPPLTEVPNIKAAVLGVYSDDTKDFANEGRDQLEAALKAAGVTHEIKIYPDTQHAFHDDTGPRYNQEQARAAWNDALAWFGRYVMAAGS